MDLNPEGVPVKDYLTGVDGWVPELQAHQVVQKKPGGPFQYFTAVIFRFKGK